MFRNVDVIAGVSLGHVLRYTHNFISCTFGVNVFCIIRSLCGVANTENGGSIYIGVLENGRAKGIGLNRNEVYVMSLFCANHCNNTLLSMTACCM